MKKLALGCALVASLALPGIASAADRHEVREAARECRAEREAMGAEQFRAEHRSLGRCIRATVRENRAERRQAARECRAEREAMGAEDFREQYGTNRNKRNAFGKCVSSKVAENEESAGAQPEDGAGQDAPAAQGEDQGRRGGAGRPEGAGRPA